MIVCVSAGVESKYNNNKINTDICWVMATVTCLYTYTIIILLILYIYVCVCVYLPIHLYEPDMTHGQIFKFLSLTSVQIQNCPSPRPVNHTKIKEPSLPYNLFTAGERIVVYISTTASSRIWSWVAMSFSYAVNHYIQSVSYICVCVCVKIYTCICVFEHTYIY